MSTELQTDVSPSALPMPPLSAVLETDAQIETQVGEIYITFAAAFSRNPELRERFKNGLDNLGGWKPNPDERTQRI